MLRFTCKSIRPRRGYPTASLQRSLTMLTLSQSSAGDGGVGKSSVTLSLLRREFSHDYDVSSALSGHGAELTTLVL